MRLASLGLTCLLSVAVAVACGDDDDDVVDSGPGDSDAATGPVDGGPAADADQTAPDAGAGGIQCGDTTCDGTTEECCLSEGLTCVAVGTCEGEAFGCDGPEDCPTDGESCCGGGEGTQCQSDETCSAVICHTADDCPDPPGPGTNECCPIGDLDVSVCLRNCGG